MKCLTCCAALCSMLCLGLGANCLDQLDVEIPDCRQTLDAVVALADAGCDAEACPFARVLRTSPGEMAAGLLGIVLEPEDADGVSEDARKIILDQAPEPRPLYSRLSPEARAPRP